MTTAERFWAKVHKTPDCWIWTASTSQGYGMFAITPTKITRAYRVPFILNGIDIEGKVIHHLCPTRACVNPDHLAILNSPRAHGKLHAGDTCSKGHPRTPENRRHRNRPGTECRICERLRKGLTEHPLPPKWTKDTIVEALQAWAEEHGRQPTAKRWNVAGTTPSFNCIQRHFGSWANAIEAAGFPKPHHGTRSTELATIRQ